MTYYWLVIVLPWIGPASPQYISNGGPDVNDILNLNRDSVLQYPLENSGYYNIQNEKCEDTTELEKPEVSTQSQSAKLPMISNEKQKQEVNWAPNVVNSDRMVYLRSDGGLGAVPYVIQQIEEYSGGPEKKSEDDIRLSDKKSFSPWGGKRDPSRYAEDMWTWKRTANLREPSMPKRVRFSPWGGKRSSPVILKTGARGSRIIFMNSFPEITRIFAALKGSDTMSKFQKRRPLNIWTVSSRSEDSTYNGDKLPSRSYIESTKFYKHGNPFEAVLLKKDRKRKVKFSAWGGKRAPPVIGPIWNPLSHMLRDNTVDKIISESNFDQSTQAF